MARHAVESRPGITWNRGPTWRGIRRLAPADNQSTFSAEDGISFGEFNYYESSNDINAVSCVGVDDRVNITGEAYDFHSSKTFSFSINYDRVAKSYEYRDDKSH